MELIHKEEAYAIVGALYEVYNEKGAGFLEPVYHECLKHEFRIRNINAVSEPRLNLTYKGIPLEQTYRPDFVCYGKIIVELKAVKVLLPEHKAQVINYLKATGYRLALLVNFSDPNDLFYERIAL